MAATNVQILGLGPMTAGLVLTPIMMFEAWLDDRRAAQSASHAGREIAVNGPLHRLQGLFHAAGQVLRRRARA